MRILLSTGLTQIHLENATCRSEWHSPSPSCSARPDLQKLQQFLYRSTTVGTLYATSLEGFGYGDVAHQFEKHCKLSKVHII